VKVRIIFNMTTLDLLAAGARAVIDDVTLNGDGDATVLRLVEMGMTAKAPIVVTRRAPLGDPIEVEVRGTRVVLRRAEAARFRVTASTTASAKADA
jgi:ferrous iron transport protein A